MTVIANNLVISGNKELLTTSGIHRLPGTGQVLRNVVFLFHSCAGHGGISLELLLHPRHFG